MADTGTLYKTAKVACMACDATFIAVSENNGVERVCVCPVCGKETPVPEWKGFPGNRCDRCNEPLESPAMAGSKKCAHLGFVSGSAAY